MARPSASAAQRAARGRCRRPSGDEQPVVAVDVGRRPAARPPRAPRRCRPCRSTRPAAARATGRRWRCSSGITIVSLSRPAAHAGGHHRGQPGGGVAARRSPAGGRPCAPPSRAGRRRRRRPAAPARGRSATAPSSARRCRAGSRTWRRSPARAARAARSLPGSVITAKRAGSGWRSQAHARWLRVSSVEPDLDAATCSVRSGGSSRAEPGDRGRVGGVEHVEGRAPRRVGAACGPPPRGTGSTRPCPPAARGRRRRPAPRTRAAGPRGGPHVGHDGQPARAGRRSRSGRHARACGRAPRARGTASRSASSARAAAVSLGERSEAVGGVVERHVVTCYQPTGPARTGSAPRNCGGRDRCRSTVAEPWRRLHESVTTRPATPRRPDRRRRSRRREPPGHRSSVTGGSSRSRPRSRCRSIWLGYGTDLDIGFVLDSAARASATSTTRPPAIPACRSSRRSSGCSTRWAGTSSSTWRRAGALLAAVLGVARLVTAWGHDNGDLVALAFLASPIVLVSGTQTADFVWAVAFLVWGALLLVRHRPVAAGVLLALALGAAQLDGAGRRGPVRRRGVGSRRASWRCSRRGGDRSAGGAAVRPGVAVVRPHVRLPRRHRRLGVAVDNSGWLAAQELRGRRAGADRGSRSWPCPPLVRSLRNFGRDPMLRFAVLALLVTEVLFLRMPWKPAHLVPSMLAMALWIAASERNRRPFLWLVIGAMVLNGGGDLPPVHRRRARFDGRRRLRAHADLGLARERRPLPGRVHGRAAPARIGGVGLHARTDARPGPRRPRASSARPRPSRRAEVLH